MKKALIVRLIIKLFSISILIGLGGGIIVILLNKFFNLNISPEILGLAVGGIIGIITSILIRNFKSKVIIEEDSSRFGYDKLTKKSVLFGIIFWPTCMLATFFAYKYNFISPQLYYLGLSFFGFFLLFSIPALYQVNTSILIDEEDISVEFPFRKKIKIKWRDISNVNTAKSYSLVDGYTKTIVLESARIKIKLYMELEEIELLMKKIKERAVSLKSVL